MKNLLLSAALILGVGATTAQTNEQTLRQLKNQNNKKVTIISSFADTLKIIDNGQVYTFIDSISATNPDKKLAINKDTLNNKIEIVLVEQDTTVEQKKDLLVHMNDLTITLDSVEYSNLDTAILRLGNRRIIFIHDGDKTTIEIPEKSEWSTDLDDMDFKFEFDDDFDVEEDITSIKRKKKRFYGRNWGFEFGINGFMDSDNSMVMSGDLDWLDLKQARSWNFNLNFWDYSIGFGSPNIGLVTGAGFSFNNYHFSNPLTLKIENGITTADSSFFSIPVRRTKLSTFGFNIPLLLEVHIPTGGHRKINVSAGVIGEVRISTRTKVVYDIDGDKRKERNGSDFNMSTFKYYFTARIGYGNHYLFANYSPIQLFEKDKGPQVYPFSMGIGFSI